MSYIIKKIKSFKKQLHYGSVGIVLYYGKLVLLVHPTGSDYNDWSYPKGKVKPGEKMKETTIREFHEEIGVELPNNFLDGKKIFELDPIKKNKGIKHYWYFKHNLTHDEFKKYFNMEFVIPQDNLQIEEIDEARFVDIKIAKKLISPKFLPAIL